MLITAEDDNTDSPLTHAPAWPAGFEQAGRALADLAHHAQLTRGLRAVLTDHLLFAFNRLGISATDQAVLATVPRDGSSSTVTAYPALPRAAHETTRLIPLRSGL